MIVTGPAVRDAIETDLPSLTAIYNHYVEHTHVTFDLEPFTIDQRHEWFSHYAPTGRHRLVVATVDEVVVGYATTSPFRDKAAYATSVETTVYVAPDAGGQGIGSALYTRLLTVIGDEDVHRAYAGIALPNEASVTLHRRFGFDLVGTYREVGRKFGRWWDVAWFERPVSAAAAAR